MTGIVDVYHVYELRVYVHEITLLAHPSFGAFIFNILCVFVYLSFVHMLAVIFAF